MNEPRLPDELRSTEAMLASLKPRRDRLSQERLWFEAGRRAALASWQAERVAERSATIPSSDRWTIVGASAAAAVAAMSATLLMMSWMRPQWENVSPIDRRDPLPSQHAAQAPKHSLHTDRALAAGGGADERDESGPAPAIPDRAASVVDHANAGRGRGSRATQLETLGLLLRNDADLTTTPRGDLRGTDRAHGFGVGELPTNFQLRQAVLSEHTSRGSQPDRFRASVQGA